jgi:glycosyltransferase involved in cell wall biosynthesis
MRITLYLNHLLNGGAARVAAYLSQAWAEQGRSVTLLTNDDGSQKPHFPLHPEVSHWPLALRAESSYALQAVANNFWRLLRLRRAILESRPDVVISFLDGNNVLCLIATCGPRHFSVIVSERTDPHGRDIGQFWENLRRLTYPWANCLVTQSQHALSYFSSGVQRKGVVVPNPVLLPAGFDRASTSKPKERKLLLTLGSLRVVKGHDLLIDAFSTLANSFPDWDLAIYGEGPERGRLQERISGYGLSHRIHMPGHVADVGRVLATADLFVMPSRAEGFPNALAEAMACGLPVVSFDCHSGPSELIRPGIDGVLVPPRDVPALTESLSRLMADSFERDRLASRAPDVLERFSLDRILERWESILINAIFKYEKNIVF